MINPYRQMQATDGADLAGLAWERLKNNPHGDFQHWLQAIDDLPAGDGYCCLDSDVPELGHRVENPKELRETLMKLHPWRKGPLQMGGVYIDTEWRSDWKWNRLAPHLNLEGQQVLDIGCGNGYFGLRMLGAGAKQVVGVDPTMVFVMQWLAMQKFAPHLPGYVLPLGIEDLPESTGGFDSVFSMGVLYHRRDPVEHLARLGKLAKNNGQVILETLVIEGDHKAVLEPDGRYARMRNVHAVPTISMLNQWIAEAGLGKARLLDINTTTLKEQRSTDWMQFESLEACLDPQNQDLTVEGHPRPIRAALQISGNG